MSEVISIADSPAVVNSLFMQVNLATEYQHWRIQARQVSPRFYFSFFFTASFVFVQWHHHEGLAPDDFNLTCIPTFRVSAQACGAMWCEKHRMKSRFRRARDLWIHGYLMFLARPLTGPFFDAVVQPVCLASRFFLKTSGITMPRSVK
jgi:hypothetical protein